MHCTYVDGAGNRERLRSHGHARWVPVAKQLHNKNTHMVHLLMFSDARNLKTARELQPTFMAVSEP